MTARSKRPRRRVWLLAALLITLVYWVATRPTLRTDFVESTRALAIEALGIAPRQLYGLRIWLAGVDDTDLGKRWYNAVARAQAAAVNLSDPYQIRARFTNCEPLARVYQTRLARGAAIALSLTRIDNGAGRLFADLERRADDDWQLVAALRPDGHSYRHAVTQTGRYRVVLQPTLLADVTYRLAIATGGSLMFPVVGGHQYDIGGGFGAARDNGQRRHKGVDIFADRSTPVRAVTAGRVTLGRSGIGGNHIWLSQSGYGRARFYYAHLDKFSVAAGAQVEAGQIIGRVGNTGNAQSSPPHLHFGIYTTKGAIDPVPFIRPPPDLPRVAD